MSTRTAVPLPKDEDHVVLRSSVLGRTIYLSDDVVLREGVHGDARLISKGNRIKFHNGYAQCPREALPLVEANMEWGRSLFMANDPKAPAPASVQVTAGAATTGSRPEVAAPAPDLGWEAEDWDDVRNADLQARIRQGQYDANLEDAMLYEMRNRCRQQIVGEIRKRTNDLRKGNADGDVSA